MQWVISEDKEGVLILAGKDSILYYQRTTKSLDGRYPRANYIHPLYGLSNQVLTEDFPEDHPHHRGIFWAWHQNYVGEKSVGDGWALENFSWELTKLSVEQHPDSCILKTDVFWNSPLWLDKQGGQKPFVREKAQIKIYALKGNYRQIDFHIELQALEDSVLIGGSEDEKGYGGFSWRIPLSEDVTFVGEQGQVEPQNLALDAGAWMNINGNLDKQGDREGILVISHPSNPGHPQAWILRKRTSMQNVVYPGREKVWIKRNIPLILRYRMLIYDGKLNTSRLHKVARFE